MSLDSLPPNQTAEVKKAAVILLALGGSMSSNLLKNFEIDEIKRFVEAAAELEEIDADYLINLVDELSVEMGRGDPLIGGDLQARAFLDEALPLDKVKAVYSDDDGHILNIWKKFTQDNEVLITPYLLDEHPQTAAFILSNLDVDLSPKIIATLPREFRTTVVLRLMKIGNVKVSCSQIVQRNLQNDLLLKADNSAELEGRDRIAKLLNKMEKASVEAILEGMNEVSPMETAAIRKLLFSFEDIVRLSQKDRMTMFDKVQTEQVMLALRGATSELREAVLSSLGARARRMIEAELSSVSSEVTKDVVSARQGIAEIAIKLGGGGVIHMGESEETSEILVGSEAKT